MQLTLSRVQFIADVSLVSQCDLEELKIAMSLIADLAQGTIPTTDNRGDFDKAEVLEYLKAKAPKHQS
ncbi:hypothetical protein ABRZ24_20975 [Brenneria populi]|uniref:Uncharacterized protein n=2 Tax=Brenneria populi TaxID=1505588 RepID=A0ABU6JWC4_9GAMM|nr:hypothetical protein [Brenneria populi Li et al. 2015]